MPERLRTALTWVKAEPRSNPGDDAALAADAFRLLGAANSPLQAPAAS